MKKFTATVLLAIYLFNIGGQLTLHPYFAYLSDRFFTEQTRKGMYYTGDLTEITIPLNMPAIADWKNFENISGQIQFENVSYNYVKMKITRTAMYLMCVPDYQTTRFSGRNIINAMQAKSVPVPKRDHVPYGKIVFGGQFNFTFAQFAFSNTAKTVDGIIVPASPGLAFQCRDIPEQPPRSSC